MKRRFWIGQAILWIVVAVVAVVTVFFLVLPVPHTMNGSVSIGVPTAGLFQTCGEVNDTQVFPPSFSGPTHLSWTAAGGPVQFWVHIGAATPVYDGSGISGSGNVDFSAALPYVFTVTNCNRVAVGLHVALAVTYEAPRY
jgi:hypothetical protein